MALRLDDCVVVRGLCYELVEDVPDRRAGRPRSLSDSDLLRNVDLSALCHSELPKATLSRRKIPSSSSLSTMAPEESDRESGSHEFSRKAIGLDRDELGAPRNGKRHDNQRGGCPLQSLHARVPKTVDFSKKHAATSDDCVTTVMVRNLPNRLSQNRMIEELNNLGFNDTFDFLYIPLDLGTMSNVGYAFVNFTHPVWAAKCMQMLPGASLTRKSSGKVIATSPAYLQGLEANMQHYEKSAVKTARLRQRRPVVLSGAPRMPDTESIRLYQL